MRDIERNTMLLGAYKQEHKNDLFIFFIYKYYIFYICMYVHVNIHAVKPLVMLESCNIYMCMCVFLSKPTGMKSLKLTHKIFNQN